MSRSAPAGAVSPVILAAALASWALPALARPPASERTAAAVMAVEHEWLTALQRHDVPRLLCSRISRT